VRRSDLIKALRRENPGLLADDVARIVEVFFDELAQSLKAGERVEMRGFGAFRAVAREPRIGRNPVTGEVVAIRGKRYPHFRPAKALRDRVRLG
jgi:integration host factor subunit beta